ncbi:efflux RND transporter periplasmic adaptor subunit [candidate division KSB1 bacterium]
MLSKLKELANTRAKYYAAAAIVIIIGLSYMGIETVAVEVEMYEVQNGEFIVRVVTAGELIARESRVISAPADIRNALQIVDIVPEGTNVKAGDFLLKFDTAELENRLIEQEEQLAEQMLQRDELLASQKSEMVQREAQLQIQRYTHEQSIIRYELMKFEPEIKQRQQEIDMKKADLQLLEAEEEIARLKVRHQQGLDRLDQRLDRTRNNIDNTKAEIEAATMYAPMDGLVVYKENYMQGTSSKIKVGQEVHRRMALIELPDLSVMKVKTAVNEVDISKVRTGQEVIVSLDANENIYYGTITEIARLARSESDAAMVKVFDIEVTISNNDETLKPGMSATCQIITDRIQDVTFVPLQSVFEEEGERYVYMGNDYRKTTIVTGQRNTDFVVVEEGLEAGQTVTLRNPFSQLEAIGTDIKEKPVVTATGNGSAPAMNMDRAVSEMRGRMMRR